MSYTLKHDRLYYLIAGLSFLVLFSFAPLAHADCTIDSQSAGYSTPFDNVADYYAASFVAGCSGTVTSGVVGGKTDGSPPPYFVAIYSDSGGSPDSQIGTLSDPATISGGSCTTQSFSNISASITSGTTYWLVVIADGGSGGYPDILALCSDANSGHSKKSADGISWDADNGSDFYFSFSVTSGGGGGGGDISSIIASASTTFAATTGFYWDGVINYLKSLVLLIVGMGLGMLQSLIPWILVLAAIIGIVGLIKRAFRFFKY